MVEISIDKFAKSVVERTPGKDINVIKKSLKEALAAKKAGAKCPVCGNPIWAAGSGITGDYMCFTCITGEADDSEDYEIVD